MKLRRRALAAGVVAAAVGVALAAVPDPPKLRANPTVRVIHAPGPGMISSSLTLTNQTSDPVTITSITRDPSCDDEVTHVLALPAIIPGNGSTPITIQCAGTITGGHRRCLFHANPPAGNALVNFEGVCEGGLASTISAAPDDLDFGDVTIGASSSTTVMLSNNAATQITRLSLHTTDLESTFELGAPCNPDARECDASIATIASGETTPITVSCRPKRAGANTAELHVAAETGQFLSAPITLACNGVAATTPVLVITGDPVDAGGVDALAGSASPAPLRLRNAGASALQITNVQIFDGGNGAASDWSYVASGECNGSVPPVCELAPEEVLSLRLEFDPSSIGARGATLVIDYFDTATRSRSIPLEGEGLGATLSLVGGVQSFDFGTVPINITSDLPFQLANQGNRTITAMLDPVVSPFSLVPSASINVVPGMPGTVVASCRPTAVGEALTTIGAMGSDAFMSGAIEIPARCEGTTSPLYAVPSSIMLGQVRVSAGTTSVPIQVLVSSGAQLTIASATLATSSALLDVVANLPMSTPTTIQLEVTPSNEGDLDNELVLVASSGATVRVPISGTIATATYQQPLARSLGTFCVSQPTTSDTLALRSTGTATLQLEAPVMALGPMSPFDIEPQAPSTYPILLGPAGVAIVEVTPRRQGSAGVQQDDIVWTTDVDLAETSTTTISARFVDDGGAVAPDALSFGPGTIHLEQDNAQKVTLQNCDTQTIVFADPSVPPPFRLDSANFPPELAPNESATFTIGFHPTRVGFFDETLTILSEQLDEPLTVRLTGEGARPVVPPDAGVLPPFPVPQSFYGCGGCSTPGDSSAVLVIGIAGVGLRVMKRRRRKFVATGAMRRCCE
ncbi:MAG: choice-of-anchor D domain-containing protein [Kofleriaceae bacterium]